MKILLISDTHAIHNETTLDIIRLNKDCDMIIHAGDFMTSGYLEKQVIDFLNWYNSLPNFKYKIFIAGNHDRYLENKPLLFKEILNNYSDLIYLENSEIIIENIKFYGTPIQPYFHNWAFNVHRGETIKRYWDIIPDDTNVLIVHGPPYGYGDEVFFSNYEKEHVGCKDLSERIENLKDLKMCISGHIHSGHGIRQHQTNPNLKIINASLLDESYTYTYEPIIIEL